MAREREAARFGAFRGLLSGRASQQPTNECGSCQDDNQLRAVAVAHQFGGAVDHFACCAARRRPEIFDEVVNDRITRAGVLANFFSERKPKAAPDRWRMCSAPPTLPRSKGPIPNSRLLRPHNVRLETWFQAHVGDRPTNGPGK